MQPLQALWAFYNAGRFALVATNVACEMSAFLWMRTAQNRCSAREEWSQFPAKDFLNELRIT